MFVAWTRETIIGSLCPFWAQVCLSPGGVPCLTASALPWLKLCLNDSVTAHVPCTCWRLLKRPSDTSSQMWGKGWAGGEQGRKKHFIANV